MIFKHLHRLSFFLLSVAIVFSPSRANVPAITHIEDSDMLSFRENKGQWDSHILYKLDVGSAQIYAERGRFTWALHSIEDLQKRADYFHGGARASEFTDTYQNPPIIRSHAFRMNFLGSNIEHGVSASEPSQSYSNYFKGNDSGKWASKVRDYKTIEYHGIYDGIDLKFYNSNSYLKYEFILEAGVDPSVIQIEYEGADELNIVSGNLYVVTSVAEVKELRPYAYQIINGREIKIPCEFQVNNNILTYHLPEGYNKNYELIIDPTLIFSSYSGSESDNWGMTATPGPNGELYGAGVVFGRYYPTTTGAYDETFNSQSSPFSTTPTDIGITKFSADGTSVIYATYLGGRYSDIPHSMIVNSKGELIVYGTSSSNNFPTSNNAYGRSHNGGIGSRSVNGIPVRGSDIIVSILSEDGSELIGSTFIGGSGEDGAMYDGTSIVKNYSDQLRGEVYVDSQDNIYVASCTNSKDFPVKSGFQTSQGGAFDAVVFSLNPNVSELRWSSYLGGEGDDAAYSIKIDQEDNIFVAGGTISPGLFNFSDVIQPSYGGATDGFLVKISPDGSQLLRGTYIGTNRYDQAYFTEIGIDGSVYVYGQSEGNMPVSSGVYSNNGGGMFIQKISPDLKERLMATRIGSGRNIANLSPSAFLVDNCNRIYISGWGGNTNSGYNSASTTHGLPVTPDALQPTTDGSDFYFMVLEEDATALLYASFFGGVQSGFSGGHEHVDGGTSRFSKEGVIYQAVCAGCRGSNSFPTTDDAVYPDMMSTNCNLGVFKMAFELDEIVATASVSPDTMACYPFTITLKNSSKGTNEYLWDFGDGNTSTDFEPTYTFTESGDYDIMLVAKSHNICLEPDTAYLRIIITDPPEGMLDSIILCVDTLITLESRLQDPEAEFLWNTGEITRSINVQESGLYIVETNFENCIYRDSFFVKYLYPISRIKDEIVCDAGELNLILDGRADNIVWNTGDTTSNINISEDGIYIVSYNIEGCVFSDTANIVFPLIPQIVLHGENIACEGEEIMLSVENISEATIISYDWNTGESGQDLTISSTGEYIVTAITDDGCTDQDSIDVYFIPLKPEPDVPDSTILLCSDKNFSFDLSYYDDEGTTITWNDGSSDYVRIFDRSGTFIFTIVNQCQTITDKITVKKSEFSSTSFPAYTPNAFTPNDDGVNDGFRPLFNPDMTVLNYEFQVFDRWGNRIFKSLNHLENWDGYFKEKKMNPGVYIWTLDVNYFICDKPNTVTTKGNVTILE